MNPRLQAAILPDGRLHLHDGPIDLIVSADGPGAARRDAYRAATRRFATVLDELCAELPLLRSPVRADASHLDGVVARRMHGACAPLSVFGFITPMAAVAGSVAEEILAAMTGAADLSRAAVNNGGDIALHLTPGATFTIGLVESPDRPALDGTTTLGFDQPVRGVATSGRGGRSFSLGIADAVTVLASRASRADAAATVVGNAVDLPGHPAVMRRPARDLQPDNDLGARLVTREVGPLTASEIDEALDRGARVADDLLARGLVAAVAIRLRGRSRIIGLFDRLAPLDLAAATYEKNEGRRSAWPR
jgi:ApbE superfamily uncharacterized protein (UPF0280 family)